MPRAVLKLESIGDNLIALHRAMERQMEDASGGFGALLFWGRIHSSRMKWYAFGRKAPWVAEILGRDHRYKLKRRFVRGTKDYLEANSTGSRGVHYYFALTDGIYEVYEHISWKHTRRRFIAVVHGEILELTKDELEACLNEKEHLAKACLTLPASE